MRIDYFKTTFRALWKNKTFTFLNVSGLAIGIAAAALILLWIEKEATFDHHFSKRNNIYRVMENQTNEGKISTNGSTPGPLAEAVKNEIPGIKDAGRLSWAIDQLAAADEKSVPTQGAYVDPSVVSMFNIPFVSGSTQKFFDKLESIIISESLAKKLFGTENAVGKTISMKAGQAYGADGSFQVTAVYKDFPLNSTYKFAWFSPYVVFENTNDWIKPWSNNLTETLVELQPSADVAAINAKLYDFIKEKTGRPSAKCFLFNMNDWHLRNHFTDGKQDGGNIRYVKLFMIIAVIILIIACVNFTNLSTALSDTRSREVGVRKVLGASKNQLVGRFIGESLCMSAIAGILAIAIIQFVSPWYSMLVGQEISPDILNLRHIMSLIGIVLATGLIAGIYPAFHLSSAIPVKVLKGLRIKTTAGAIFIRKGLVTVQFAVSIALILCTAIIYQQIQHIKQRNLGFEKERVGYMNLQGAMKKNFSVIRSEMIKTGMIENAAVSLHDPLHIYSSSDKYDWPGKEPNNKVSVHSNVVSQDFLSVMHMRLIGGKDFSSTPGNVIINKSMAALMGDAGKAGGYIAIDTFKLNIAGVVADVVFNDAYSRQQPLILFSYPGPETVMNVRIRKDADLHKALSAIENIVTAHNPGYPFAFSFLDEQFNALFNTETLIGNLATVFSGLAIFISCLGLFGLAAYSAERRRKEIGVRRVLGASVSGLAGLLSKEFLKLVALSCVIAFPLSWYVMSGWLQDFQYRTTIQWWLFAAAGVVSILIALLTVSFQAIRVATANPVKVLRTE